ncbi:ABC transporter permease [Pseudoruegeria sp. SK021]|uniref:ABC transporter permease n=1 Tax=Pseudoruegeria sp. SK021 TaxID=1933035 RepID=UPI000A23AD0C|nr:ABC transporter permease [Pseudoruegeria sp. SK021]OSP53405.1 ABC transporter permease [Pseudoruegeria sp. SK021]
MTDQSLRANNPSTIATGLNLKEHAQTVRRKLVPLAWTCASLGLFVAIWEFSWWQGWANPLLLPPPHIFLSNLPEQFRFFDPTGGRAGALSEGGSIWSVLGVIGWSALRVTLGLSLGFVMSLIVGVAIRYFNIFGKLVLPLVTMMAPISPVAWIPVAVFMFGIGNPPAVFLVFIAIFFVMVLATLSQIDAVPPHFIQLARIMGASKRQIYMQVILPAILPGLFVTLRMNLFAAWMVVLIAEAVGVGSGLGQVTMMARNTFNSSLVFFTMTLIGITGFAFDQALGLIQRKILWWIGPSSIGRI